MPNGTSLSEVMVNIPSNMGEGSYNGLPFPDQPKSMGPEEPAHSMRSYHLRSSDISLSSGVSSIRLLIPLNPANTLLGFG